MTVGVCIVAAGRRAHLSRALHSLTMQHRAPDQIVVVALDDQPVVRARHRCRDRPAASARRRAVADRRGTQPRGRPPDDRRAGHARRRLHRRSGPRGPLRRGLAPPPGGPGVRRGALPPPGLAARRRCVRHLGPRRTQCCTGRPAAAAARRDVDRRRRTTTCSGRSASASPGRCGTGSAASTSASSATAQRTPTSPARARRLGVPLAWFAGGTAYHQWHLPARHDRAPCPRAGGQRPPVPRTVGQVADVGLAGRPQPARLGALRRRCRRVGGDVTRSCTHVVIGPANHGVVRHGIQLAPGCRVTRDPPRRAGRAVRGCRRQPMSSTSTSPTTCSGRRRRRPSMRVPGSSAGCRCGCR